MCLVSLAWPEESCHFEELKRLCDDTYLLVSVPVFTDTLLASFQTDPIRFLPRVLKGVLKHFRIRAQLNGGIRDLIARHRPDVIQVEYTIMALYLKKLSAGPCRVLHLHDLMMKPYARLWAAERTMALRISRYLFYLILKSIELKFCRSFDRVLLKSCYDRKLLLQCGNFDTQVFPLGVHQQAATASYASREARSVLFVGAMFRNVNEEAALYFIDRVMPELERKVGPVKFYVVGIAPSVLLKGRCAENIVVSGYVEDLSPFYNNCHAFVAPLFVGGGMIFKVLQAMSFGLPVVATAVANEGIEGRDGSELLIAESAEEFADRLASLMSDAELWQRISRNGQAYVNARYSWDVVVEEYLKDLL